MAPILIGSGRPSISLDVVTSLDQALRYMEESELVAETLGEQVFHYVLRNKREEWNAYRAQVTPFELRTNLEML